MEDCTDDTTIECFYCGLPIEYDDAEPIEDKSGRGMGPKLVCSDCARTCYNDPRDPMFNTYSDH